MIFPEGKNRIFSEQAFQACLEGDAERLEHLVAYHFNLEDCDEEGNSALHYAVRGGNMDVIRMLTEQGGLDPCWSNQNMITPMHLARELCPEAYRYFTEQTGFSLEESYQNPVRRGMHPDPSIVRVGEDYYMVNSSFIMFPCIPISHSRDLIHWTVIGYAVTDAAWAEAHLGHLEGGRGFWAPDISYYDGRFYICATLRNNDDAEYIQTQMVTSAARPEGPYETPVIHEVLGIDPSLFTDEDGRRYMLINRGARIMEISPDGREILSQPRLIWYGSDKHAPEGPHLLKKDGWYYCFLAEGGTGKGHKITVARSKHLYGPYEDCPYNPIMQQKHTAGVIQCTGHGKPVSTADGRWFIVYLCSRFLEGKWGILGRETCLDEIHWTEDGWPLIHQGRGPGVLNPLPLPTAVSEFSPVSEWMTPRSMDRRYLETLPEENGEESFRIRGCGLDLCDKNCRSLILKNQPDFSFDCCFELLTAVPEGEDTGVTLYYDENTYLKFGRTTDEVFVSEYYDDQYVRTVREKVSDFEKGKELFRIETRGLKRIFYYRDRKIAEWNVTGICSEGLVKGKRFTSAMYGVYVNGKNLLCWRQHSNI